jgi:DnaJ-class molecular chaperone
MDDLAKATTKTNQRKVCYTCGGKRSIQYIGEEPCGDCAGTGRNTRSDLWSEPCLKCNGSRKVAYSRWKQCYTCGGTGTMIY